MRFCRYLQRCMAVFRRQTLDTTSCLLASFLQGKQDNHGSTDQHTKAFVILLLRRALVSGVLLRKKHLAKSRLTKPACFRARFPGKSTCDLRISISSFPMHRSRHAPQAPQTTTRPALSSSFAVGQRVAAAFLQASSSESHPRCRRCRT